MDFPMVFLVILSVSSMFGLKLLVTYYKHCFINDGLQTHFVSYDSALCVKEIHELDLMDLKIS